MKGGWYYQWYNVRQTGLTGEEREDKLFFAQNFLLQ